MIKPSSPTAVWDGRFQPLHVGHVAVIQAIIEQFDTDLAVMIIHSTEGERDSYSAEVNRHHRRSRNPLTFWERYNLLRLALQPLPVAERITLLGIPRPDLFWEIASAFYPDRRFICLTGKDAYEKSKEVFWSGLGEETRVIDIRGLPTVSATEFKSALKAGNNWEQFLPPPCHDYFRTIDGPQRFCAADI